MARKAGLVVAHVLDDPLAAHDLDVLERHRRLHGVAAEGHPVRVHRARLPEGLHHPLARDQRADGGVGRGQALGAGDQVGRDAEALGGEPVPDAPEAGDHLVEAEQDAVRVAELAHALEVARRAA